MLYIGKDYIMKRRITEIFRLLLGVVALVCTMFIALGRLCWKTIRTWWKNRSVKVKKWTKAAVCILVIWIVGDFCYDICNNVWGREEWRDETISENVEIRYFNDGSHRLYNSETGKYTTPRLEWISINDENPYGVYALNGKRGYVNTETGEIIIDADANNYRKAWMVSEGLAAVWKDGKVGFINTDGDVVIPFQYEYNENCAMWDYGILFHEGLCSMTDAEGKLGLINTDGEWVLPAEYDEIWVPKHGYRILIKDNRYGIADIRGNLIYPAEYGYIDILDNGFALTKGGRRIQVDSTGKTVVDFMFDDSYNLRYPGYVNENGDTVYHLSDYASYQVIQRYVIMDRNTGRPITPAVYRDIEMISYKIFKVQTENMDWILLDDNGQIIQ